MDRMNINNKCLDEKTLSSYLDKRLPDAERKKIEEHIADCDICLDMLVTAYDLCKGSKKCPDALLNNRIKNKLGLKQARKSRELGWLLGAVFFFAFSFVFKHYFLQFLAVSVVLGFKWVMEGEAAKRVVMIFKGIQEKEKKFERKPSPDVSNIAGGDKYGGTE